MRIRLPWFSREMRRVMADCRGPAVDTQPAQRLQAIDSRQDQLLAELEGLNARIEAAIEAFGSSKTTEPAAA